MAVRHNGQGFIQNPYQEDENPNARYTYRGPRSGPGGFRKPHGYTQQLGRPAPQWDGTSNYDDEEDEEDDDERIGESNDNPLYELEEDDNRGPLSSASTGQGNPNNNPLYGNDPFKPATANPTICMTEFLRPKGRRNPQREQKKVRQFDEQGPEFVPNIGRSEYEDNSDGTRSPSSPSHSRSSSPRSQRIAGHGRGHGLFRAAQGDRVIIKSYPPARFSPLIPAGRPPTDHSGPCASNSDPGKRTMQTAKSQVLQFRGQSIMDLIAAVRSDQNLLIAEVRRDGAREPRIPGDHDRYFAPRKGDIIVHFAPTLDSNKLVEYFDEKMTMLRLQVGDKLVRVKYDNYKIPDHLMITSKLYIYAPEWVYLGKAVQTIKTA